MACPCLLQWGRELMPAETSTPWIIESTIWQLQWGRELTPAETRLRPQGDDRRAPASMGPRADARGNPAREGGPQGEVTRFNEAAS